MMTYAIDLTGQVALVTGGAQGIGWATAQTLARAGAAVAIADFNAETGAKAAQALRDSGHQSLFIQVDVRDSASADAMVQACISGLGAVDILVNNAGIARNTPAEDTSNDEWMNVMNINLNGVFWCCRAVAKHMIARKSGSIVNIASMSGLIVNKPQPQTAYNVSKAGVIMLTKSLAAEWALHNVRVNSVSPGYIGTEMTKLGMSKKEWSDVWLEMTPVGHIGEPEDVANAVLYLASDMSRFATGSNVVVDGGYSAW